MTQTKTNAKELELRKELWWVYQNILSNYGKWDKELIKRRMEEVRYFKQSQKAGRGKE